MTTDTVFRKLCQSPQTNLRRIFERTQIQLDRIFCEFSQTHMYWIFVNARRKNLQEALLKTIDPYLRELVNATRPWFSGHFWMLINPKSQHTCELQQIQLYKPLCKYSQNQFLGNFVIGQSSKFQIIFWKPTNPYFRDFSECPHTKIYGHCRDIRESLYIQLDFTSCEFLQIQN